MTFKAMLPDVHYQCLLPAEEKISCPGPYCYVEVPFVSHEDEYEAVAGDGNCLQEVGGA